eukprot:scaffold7375_cov268-Pinguiococcus_pyrenoidosus.AAC.65
MWARRCAATRDGDLQLRRWPRGLQTATLRTPYVGAIEHFASRWSGSDWLVTRAEPLVIR